MSVHNQQIVGRCSRCGGLVSMHVGPWMGVIPPVPTCQSCGATKRNTGPIIEMEDPGMTRPQLLNEEITPYTVDWDSAKWVVDWNSQPKF